MKIYQKEVKISFVWGIVSLLGIGLGSYILINQLENMPHINQFENNGITGDTSVKNQGNSSSVNKNISISSQNQTLEKTQIQTDNKTLFNYANGYYIEKYADFNFDGLIDRVVVNKENNDAYRGSPHKDIYLQTNSGGYLLSPELTQLINGTGYFVVDKEKKIIITYGAGSCCTHYGIEYMFIPNIGLKEIYKISEEAGSHGGVAEDKIQVTIEHLINYDFEGEKIRHGEWVKDIKILDLETYKYFEPL